MTTETGCTSEGAITEEIQGLNLMILYLAQFKRGWSHTAVYLLRDRKDEAGNPSFGFFKPDYEPQKAAKYLHNLTAILADDRSTDSPGQLNYSIPDQPSTVHELLLQRSDGSFQLVIWDERVKGSDDVTIHFGDKVSNVKIYDPTIGTEMIQWSSGTDSLKLTLSDRPLILAIAPKK